MCSTPCTCTHRHTLPHRHALPRIVTHYRIVTVIAHIAHSQTHTFRNILDTSSFLRTISSLLRVDYKFASLRAPISEFASEFASEQPRKFGMPRRHFKHVYKEHVEIEQNRFPLMLSFQTMIVI